jgi:hypothetical protein
MYSGGVSFLWVLDVVIVIWLAGLTFWIWRNNNFLNRLFPKSEGSFKTKLDEVLKEVGSLEEFKKSSLDHLQRVALKRYNPYHDTGGDQSFSAALLDGHGDGVILSSLHSRAGTRVFAKPVKGGKEASVQFSQEEGRVVESAMAIGKENKKQ